MYKKPLAMALLTASIAIAAPAAMAEGDECFVSAVTGKVSTMFADAKAFLGFGGEATESEPCSMSAFTVAREKLQGVIQAKLADAENAEVTDAEPASCCATANRAEVAPAADGDPRLNALAKVFGPAVTKNASVPTADDAGCAAEAASCPLEAATNVAAKVDGEKAEADAASLPACCAKKLEASTD